MAAATKPNAAALSVGIQRLIVPRVPATRTRLAGSGEPGARLVCAGACGGGSEGPAKPAVASGASSTTALSGRNPSVSSSSHSSARNPTTGGGRGGKEGFRAVRVPDARSGRGGGRDGPLAGFRALMACSMAVGANEANGSRPRAHVASEVAARVLHEHRADVRIRHASDSKERQDVLEEVGRRPVGV